MMTCSIDITVTNLILLGALVFVAKKLWKLAQQWKAEKMLEKWSNSPVRDKVILHSIWRARPIPSISPFGLKLETYLRMAKIPYELDSKDPMGPKGKLPWITYNGTHVADSHLCIEFLKKKFSVDLNKSASSEHVATARACRVMLEERFFWGLVQYRVFDSTLGIATLMRIPPIFKYVMPFLKHNMKKKMEQNGIGLHTRSEIYQMTEDDLRTVASVLGNMKFMGGDVACEEDCAIFGMVAQAVWGLPGSSFERLVEGELVCLKNYCERMKDLYWPDWNECLDKK